MIAGTRTAGLLALLGAILATAPAAAQVSPEPVGPFAGENPFRCTLQSVGAGTDFPDPDADPFCVEFDKTNQNVTGFGIVDFVLQEPSRIAIALEKCFYFQRDHWTGSIVQGSEPELWHWDGDYFFDRAKGIGGASVRNFRIGGAPQSAAPYVPPAYRPYFDEEGGGGVLVELETRPDPGCAARVDTPGERALVYAGEPSARSCVEPGGELVGRRIGRVRLGIARERVLERLGPPRWSGPRADRWCLVGKGRLRAGYGAAGDVELIQSSARGHSFHGVAHGDRLRRAFRRLELSKRIHLGGARVLEVERRSGRHGVLIGAAAGRVRWVAIAEPGLARSDRALRRALRRLR